jgi:hypothetical protein
MSRLACATISVAISAAICAYAVAAPVAAPRLAMADQPVRILRDTAVFKGVTGIPLQEHDIIETGDGEAQVETGRLIIALGASSRLCLQKLGPDNALALLSGWAKVTIVAASAPTPVTLATPMLQLTMQRGSGVAYAGDGKASMFAEDGEQSVAPLDRQGAAGAALKLSQEQYASRLAGQPPKVQPRPAQDFLAAMPHTFHDPLEAVPDRLKGAKPLAVREREADYADIAPWLKADLALRKSLVKRYLPRLRDTQFRAQLDAELGQSAEWKPILHPPPPPPKAGTTLMHP